MLLKVSTTRNRTFLLVQSADHLTGLTGATPTVTLSKDGGAFAAAGGTVTEIANGVYKIALTTTDTNTKGDLFYHVTAASADPTDFADQVVTDLPGDSVASVTAAVTVTGTPAVNVTQWNGGAVPATTVTGVPKVDVADWLGTAVTAATAGVPDVNTKNINNVAAATPGASGGILIAGSNAGTTTLGALTVTGATTLAGNVAMQAGLTVTQSTLNGHGVSITGNGTGHGILSTSGSGATGDGIKAVAASTNGNGATLAKTGSGNDLNATSTPLTLAKTTNITGFNDITAAAAATGVWQDTTAGDFTVASSIGKSLYTSGNAPGAASGLALVGSNMGSVSSVTGNVAGSVGSVTARVTANTDQINGTAQTARDLGNALPAAAPGAAGGVFIAGTNAPVTITGSGDALTITSTAANGRGLAVSGNGTGSGATVTGGATGPGLKLVGGGTSGDGVDITTTSGDGISILPTAGSAIVATGNGTSKFGIIATGGTAGTSDGVKAVAGTGGVPIRGDITGNIHGTLDTLTTYTGNTPQTGDTYARLGAPAGASTSADIAAVKTDTGNISTQVVSTRAEPSSVPAATSTLGTKVDWLFALARNKRTTTATVDTLRNDADGATIGTSTISDDGTTFVRSKYV